MKRQKKLSTELAMLMTESSASLTARRGGTAVGSRTRRAPHCDRGKAVRRSFKYGKERGLIAALVSVAVIGALTAMDDSLGTMSETVSSN